MLSPDSHVMLQLTICHQMAFRSPKTDPISLFLTPHLDTPKDITTKRGEATSGIQLYHHANLMQIGGTIAEICVPRLRKRWYYSKFSIRDTAVPAEGNGNLQTLICVLVARPRRCLTLSNPAP